MKNTIMFEVDTRHFFRDLKAAYSRINGDQLFEVVKEPTIPYTFIKIVKVKMTGVSVIRFFGNSVESSSSKSGLH